MNSAPISDLPSLKVLFALFPAAEDVPEYETVPADEVPPPYDELLVHEDHMTVTLERHHRDQVDVRVLARRQDGDSYARKILLALRGNGRVVLFGIMRIDLRYCGDTARSEIVAAQTPLGHILIRHDVLRRIEPTVYLRVIPSPAMTQWFNLDRSRSTYGRLALIHCNGQPAVELLEIVAPE